MVTSYRGGNRAGCKTDDDQQTSRTKVHTRRVHKVTTSLKFTQDIGRTRRAQDSASTGNLATNCETVHAELHFGAYHSTSHDQYCALDKKWKAVSRD